MTTTSDKRKTTSAGAARRKVRHESSSALRLRRKVGSNGTDTDDVYERILTAIMEHSLPPETRLVEERLCEIFGLGRTRLRQVLQRLAHEGVVTLMPNRGAMVSKPSVQEAREVFAARRVLESGTVAAVVETAGRADFKRLHEHLTREKAAWRENDRRAALKLSGEFHLIIAEIAGNGILLELLRDLVSRSSLIIAVFQSPGAPSCPPDEHEQLGAALEKRDRGAVDLMARHLDHVLADLRLEDHGEHRVDLRTVFSQDSRRAS